jgi:hypothetical protein
VNCSPRRPSACPVKHDGKTQKIKPLKQQQRAFGKNAGSGKFSEAPENFHSVFVFSGASQKFSETRRFFRSLSGNNTDSKTIF